MLFNLKADANFEADDIVDAFRKLAAHFTCLADNMDEIRDCDSTLIEGGRIEISPLKTSDK